MWHRFAIFRTVPYTHDRYLWVANFNAISQIIPKPWLKQEPNRSLKKDAISSPSCGAFGEVEWNLRPRPINHIHSIKSQGHQNPIESSGISKVRCDSGTWLADIFGDWVETPFYNFSFQPGGLPSQSPESVMPGAAEILDLADFAKRGLHHWKNEAYHGSWFQLHTYI